MTPTAILVVAVVVLFFVVLPKRRQFPGGGRDGARRALLLCCGALNCGLAVQLPLVNGTINRFAGFNMAWPVQHGLVVVAAWACQAFLVFSVEDDPARAIRRVSRRAAPALLVLAAMTILFSYDPGAAAFGFGPDGRLDQQQPGSPIAAATFLVFAVYLCYSSWLTMMGFWRWSRKASGVPDLRAGLTTTAVGCAMTEVYSLHMLLVQLVFLTGHSIPWHAGEAENWLIPLAGAVCLAGMCTSAFRPTWTAVARWCRLYGARRRLYPLWHMIYKTMPDIAFTPPRFYAHDWLRLRDTRHFLYRTVIELWDARNSLRPLVPRETLELAERAARQAGLDKREREATVEAVAIMAGLRAWAEEAGASTAQPVERPKGCSSLATDVAWWNGVARACTHSPLPRAILARIPLTHQAGSPTRTRTSD